MKQRDVPRLAHEYAEADHAQVGALALRVPPPRQFARGHRRDVRVEVCRIVREDVCAELELRYRRACQLELRGLELAFVRRHRKSMEHLAREGFWVRAALTPAHAARTLLSASTIPAESTLPGTRRGGTFPPARTRAEPRRRAPSPRATRSSGARSIRTHFEHPSRSRGPRRPEILRR